MNEISKKFNRRYSLKSFELIRFIFTEDLLESIKDYAHPVLPKMPV